MLVRYKNDSSGKRIKIAEIYTKEEHGLDKKKISKNALKIIEVLQSHKFEAYIVGGAVRDLLIGRIPKDFDIVTSARPRQIKRFFRNSFIIGKRFKLVHIHAQDEIIEISTFRIKHEENNNLYGNELEEDSAKRDFTINALYYCPKNEQIVDCCSGVKDLKNKLIKTDFDLKVIFDEDPVRIIRALKYKAICGFKIEKHLNKTLKRKISLLKNVSQSRLTDELFKILNSGYSSDIFKSIDEVKALEIFLPNLCREIKRLKINKKNFYNNLKIFDQHVKKTDVSNQNICFKYFFKDLIKMPRTDVQLDLRQVFLDSYKEAKEILFPLTPANKIIEDSLRELFKDNKIYIPKFKRRKKPVS